MSQKWSLKMSSLCGGLRSKLVAYESFDQALEQNFDSLAYGKKF